MLPNFIVIGAAKAGTTALYWYLAEHPGIFMSPMKETNFLAFGVDESGALLYGDPELHKFPITTRDEYEALFLEAGDATAIGEASPIYLECPQVPQRIETLIPSAKIICGLRNPVDRAYSDYQMYLRARGRRLDPAMDLRPDAPWARPDSHWVSIGKYHGLLSPYFARFPRAKIHIYLFDDMRANAPAVTKAIYGFLDVDDRFLPDFETPHNVGGVPARIGLERLLTAKGVRKALDPWVPKAIADYARRLRTSNLRAAPPLPAEMREQLTSYFREDIVKTAELVDRDLGGWL